MINKLLLEEFILEYRVEFLKDKYKDILDDKVFLKLQETDPTKNKQFTEWIIRNYLKLTQTEQIRFIKEDFSKLFDDLEFYNRYKQSIPPEFRDINKIKSFVELYEILKPIREKKESEIEQTQTSKDVTKILDDGNYSIIIPNTEEASCLYGAGTRWCTAAKSNNMFDRYNDEGPLFIVIHKTEKDKEGRENKYQFHFKSGQFMDVNDKAINLKEYIEKNPKVADTIANYYVDRESGFDSKDLIRTLTFLNRTNLIPDNVINKLKNGKTKYSESIGFDILYGLFKGGKLDYKSVNGLANDATIKLEEDGSVYALYPDGWNDDSIIKLFGQSGNNDYQYGAKQILGGDAWEWFADSQEYDSVDKIWGSNLDEKTINDIKQQMLKDSPETDSIEYMNLDGKDLIEYLSENDDTFDQLNQEIVKGANDAHRLAQEGAYWKAYTDAVIEKLGPYKFEGDTLMFKTDFDKMLQLISTLYDYQENDFNYTYYTSWINQAIQENDGGITMRNEYYDTPSNEDMNIQIRETIGEYR